MQKRLLQKLLRSGRLRLHPLELDLMALFGLPLPVRQLRDGPLQEKLDEPLLLHLLFGTGQLLPQRRRCLLRIRLPAALDHSCSPLELAALTFPVSQLLPGFIARLPGCLELQRKLAASPLFFGCALILSGELLFQLAQAFSKALLA
ncbi:hypothetical protein ACTHPH_08665 [Paenibacillus pasadenensis]|uniref:hypothetical protein n=1 Tax=Paenibacillus pasadenensis TaxID=217090 RepID=UPI000FD6C0A7|nr:hypothetical protein [Paenibacillus pasadenensis]